ncbi:hypothetical protein PR048_015182 [Dryococelus australis]|uniref:Uncharacterized protein n=1 Tax=Dryococelus australis TaxID=614101 RepID=A0ABQ9HGD8_9NEOP|nr:hypothetical protein PR048_015182 [Dryococelus australis]
MVLHTQVTSLASRMLGTPIASELLPGSKFEVGSTVLQTLEHRGDLVVRRQRDRSTSSLVYGCSSWTADGHRAPSELTGDDGPHLAAREEVADVVRVWGRPSPRKHAEDVFPDIFPPHPPSCRRCLVVAGCWQRAVRHLLPMFHTCAIECRSMDPELRIPEANILTLQQNQLGDSHCTMKFRVVVNEDEPGASSHYNSGYLPLTLLERCGASHDDQVLCVPKRELRHLQTSAILRCWKCDSMFPAISSNSVTDVTLDVLNVEGNMADISVVDVINVEGNVADVAVDVINVEGNVADVAVDVINVEGNVVDFAVDVLNVEGNVCHRLERSLRTKTNSVRFPAGQVLDLSHMEIVPDDVAGQRAFSVVSRFPQPLQTFPGGTPENRHLQAGPSEVVDGLRISPYPGVDSGSTSHHSRVGIVPDDATLVGEFSLGSPVSPVLPFRRCSILISINPIGSQDLDVKSHPNLFTHSTYFPSIVTNFTGLMSLSAPVKTYAGRSSDFFPSARLLRNPPSYFATYLTFGSLKNTSACYLHVGGNPQGVGHVTSAGLERILADAACTVARGFRKQSGAEKLGCDKGDNASSIKCVIAATYKSLN